MEWYATLALGAFIVLFGAVYVIRHRRAISSFGQDPDFDVRQREFLVAQHRRRLLTSSLLIATGLLIPALYYAMDPLRNVVLFTFLLLTLLVLVTAIGLLAIGDMMSNRFLRSDLNLKRAETELKRRMLEEELAKHQEHKQAWLDGSSRTNGKP
ncbi:hypothetical protein [Rubinisphaera margarita]|uniref:hypothetical protein n=1 Tax=Rubinisphaera margarita TaxID=2909586 RepID=UPI001EE99A25|nr:hypothetical protein [Rubinisphaera margarita]MCG6156269.1 hypothetical protein [Rubinisphaera margarita]